MPTAFGEKIENPPKKKHVHTEWERHSICELCLLCVSALDTLLTTLLVIIPTTQWLTNERYSDTAAHMQQHEQNMR